MRRIVTICVMLLIVSLAGQAVAQKPTPVPPDTLLFSDDFSDPSSGWGESREEDYEHYYEGGEYHLLEREGDVAHWRWIDGEYADFTLEVDAHIVDGPLDSGYGLVFRLQDSDNFYLFEVFGDGYYGLYKMVGGEWEDITFQESPSIKPRKGTNHLKVACQGSLIAAYINGERVEIVNDPSFQKGKVGLFVEAFEPDAHVAFDNFEVRSSGEVVPTPTAIPVASLDQYEGEEYSFSLDQETVDVWINQDGSVSLEYWFTFTCDPGAHPIDVVDVGLPTDDYSLADISADVGGVPVYYIEESEYVEHGVAVWLGDGTIEPGETGTVHVIVERVGRMIYEDSEDTEYASTEFSPTWFGSQFVHGTTDLTVRFHLPEGVQPEEPRWHRSPSNWPQDQPDTALDEEGRVLYTWHNPAAAPDRQYTFGASFPRRYVAEEAIQKGPSALETIWDVITWAVCGPKAVCWGIFCSAIVIIGFAAINIWGERRRKMHYLPPSMKVEGVGVKRGLTAVEAAILLETPLNKVLTMILFGLLKKGAVTVLDDDPLKIQINEPLPEKLHPYEKAFLEAVKKDHTLSERRLRSMMVALVKAVNNKMKGFSRKETVAYYRDIVRRAWQQVESAETPEVRSKRFDEQLEWTMLDDDFDDRMERTFRTGPVFVPVWWGYYRPWARTVSTPRPPAPSRPSAGRIQLPTLPGAAFAATIVNGVQNTAGRIVRSVTDFTGRVTKVTNPPPKPSYSGRSYSGGGSSCACACACACAGCACACAGGGR